MNKEILYALERIKHTDLYEPDTETDEAIFQGECGDIYKHEFEIIETELKRTSDYDFLCEHYRECLKENEKLNKALEIIKESFVSIGGTRGNFEGEKPTNEIVITLKDLTKKEFDLLKEVLL